MNNYTLLLGFPPHWSHLDRLAFFELLYDHFLSNGHKLYKICIAENFITLYGYYVLNENIYENHFMIRVVFNIKTGSPLLYISCNNVGSFVSEVVDILELFS